MFRKWAKGKKEDWGVCYKKKCIEKLGLILKTDFSQKIYTDWTTQQKRLWKVLSEEYLNWITSLKRWIEFIHAFQKARKEISKTRPKMCKIAKNRSFSLIGQQIFNENPLNGNQSISCQQCYWKLLTEQA